MEKQVVKYLDFICHKNIILITALAFTGCSDPYINNAKKNVETLRSAKHLSMGMKGFEDYAEYTITDINERNSNSFDLATSPDFSIGNPGLIWFKDQCIYAAQAYNSRVGYGMDAKPDNPSAGAAVDGGIIAQLSFEIYAIDYNDGVKAHPDIKEKLKVVGLPAKIPTNGKPFSCLGNEITENKKGFIVFSPDEDMLYSEIPNEKYEEFEDDSAKPDLGYQVLNIGADEQDINNDLGYGSMSGAYNQTNSSNEFHGDKGCYKLPQPPNVVPCDAWAAYSLEYKRMRDHYFNMEYLGISSSERSQLWSVRDTELRYLRDSFKLQANSEGFVLPVF